MLSDGRSYLLQNAYPALAAMLSRCAGDAWRLSDQLGARSFTHSGDQRQSLGS